MDLCVKLGTSTIPSFAFHLTVFGNLENMCIDLTTSVGIMVYSVTGFDIIFTTAWARRQPLNTESPDF